MNLNTEKTLDNQSIEQEKTDSENKNVTPSATTSDIPDFGWSNYAERINGRFAMIGFFAILLVELLSKKSSFLQWAGFMN